MYGISQYFRGAKHSKLKYKFDGKAIRNPASDIDFKEIIGKLQEKHYPTITEDTGI